MLIYIVGSIGGGKSTISHLLKLYIEKKYNKSVTRKELNITHGLSFLITMGLVRLLGYRYISNYYLSLRYNNKSFFCKIVPILEALDIFYYYIYTLIILYKVWRKDRIIIIDEGHINAIADYRYYNFLCGKEKKFGKHIGNIFYTLIIKLLLKIASKDNVLIIQVWKDFLSSLKSWIIREKTCFFDLDHIRYRSIITRMILKNLQVLNKTKIDILSVKVDNYVTIKDIIKNKDDFIYDYNKIVPKKRT